MNDQELKKQVNELFDKYKINYFSQLHFSNERFAELISLGKNADNPLSKEDLRASMLEYTNCLQSIVENTGNEFKIENFISDLTKIISKNNPQLNGSYDLAIAISLSNIVSKDIHKLTFNKKNACFAYNFIKSFYDANNQDIQIQQEQNRNIPESALAKFHTNIKSDFEFINDEEQRQNKDASKSDTKIKNTRMEEFVSALYRLQKYYEPKHKVLDEQSDFYKFIMKNDIDTLAKKFENLKDSQIKFDITAKDIINNSPPDLLYRISQLSEKLDEYEVKKKTREAISRDDGIVRIFFNAVKKFCKYIIKTKLPKKIVDELSACTQNKSIIPKDGNDEVIKGFVAKLKKEVRVKFDKSKGFTDMVKRQKLAQNLQQDKKISKNNNTL